jgi:plasmid stabilization system protein ParE
MELNIFWTDFAKYELKKIFKYLKENASQKVARNETKKIVKATNRLKLQPEIGQVEQLLVDREQKFRYLVHQTYKIIYWLNREKNQVEIVDVFDTQQYPAKIQRSNL